MLNHARTWGFQWVGPTSPPCGTLSLPRSAWASMNPAYTVWPVRSQTRAPAGGVHVAPGRTDQPVSNDDGCVVQRLTGRGHDAGAHERVVPGPVVADTLDRLGAGGLLGVEGVGGYESDANEEADTRQRQTPWEGRTGVRCGAGSGR